MKLDVHVDGDLSASLEAEIVAAEKAVTVGVTRTGEALKAAWRAQVTGAGLGRRLANAIRANRYPRSGESISAASLVFSRAAEITDAFDRGVLIRSKHGLWLAIPTAEAGTRGIGRARITPGRLGAAHRPAAALRLPPRPPEPARRRRRPGQRPRPRRGEARPPPARRDADRGCNRGDLHPRAAGPAREAARSRAGCGAGARRTAGAHRRELGGREALTAGRLASAQSDLAASRAAICPKPLASA